jgi:hypothetical protein
MQTKRGMENKFAGSSPLRHIPASWQGERAKENPQVF